ncbi:MAG: zinc dependent phospholipase C family protein [Syntrophales bacterium]|nr:zinc dependent phospholipase C family protein [Syntrophales bacterium]
MPKEITHWLICLETADLLGGTKMGDAVLHNPNALKLGAVFLDVFFFLGSKKAYLPYKDLAHILHGVNGEDTYEFVRHLIKVAKDSPYKNQILSFIAGVATHIHADAVFHPMVYYMTGDCEDNDPSVRSKAIQRHRLLETLIDMYFLKGTYQPENFNIKAILNGLEFPLIYLLARLSATMDSSFRSLPNVTIEALRNFHTMVQLSRREKIARILFAISPLLPRKIREIAGLFYSPQLYRFMPRIEGQLEFRNPVTGKENKAALRDLFDLSIQRSITLIEKIDTIVVTGNEENLTERGPSLNFDLLDQKDYRVIYSAKESIFSHK